MPEKVERIGDVGRRPAELFGKFIHEKRERKLMDVIRHDPVGKAPRKIHDVVVAERTGDNDTIHCKIKNENFKLFITNFKVSSLKFELFLL